MVSDIKRGQIRPAPTEKHRPVFFANGDIARHDHNIVVFQILLELVRVQARQLRIHRVALGRQPQITGLPDESGRADPLQSKRQ